MSFQANDCNCHWPGFLYDTLRHIAKAVKFVPGMEVQRYRELIEVADYGLFKRAS